MIWVGPADRPRGPSAGKRERKPVYFGNVRFAPPTYCPMPRPILPLSVLAVIAVAVVLILSGCSETACQEADRKGEATHACYVERHENEPAVLKEEEQEEHADEVEEEVEEVEEVLKQEKAEETAQLLRELEGR